MTENDAVPLLGEALRHASPREGVTMSLHDYEGGRLRVIFTSRRREFGVELPLEAALVRDTPAWRKGLAAMLWAIYDQREGAGDERGIVAKPAIPGN